MQKPAGCCQIDERGRMFASLGFSFISFIPSFQSVHKRQFWNNRVAVLPARRMSTKPYCTPFHQPTGHPVCNPQPYLVALQPHIHFSFYLNINPKPA
jgi:hypothetical protein